MKEVLTEKNLMEKSSQELTSILYIGCIEKLQNTIEAINNKDYEQANNLMQKCNDIVYRLGAGIKYEAGLIADQLDNLYNYIAEVLIEANLKKDVKLIEMVLVIMKELSEAWDVAMSKGFNKGRINKNVLKYEESSIDGNNSDEKSHIFHK